jgi:glutamate dehydrogenase
MGNNKNQNSLHKVVQLQDLLKSKPELLNGSASTLLGVDLELLVGKFFSKAPTDFIDKKSVDELTQILKNCTSSLQEFLTKKETELVKTFKLGNSRSSLISIVKDKPFIVNTVSESIRSCDYKIDILLHPVFTLDDMRISVTYVELDGLNQDQLSNLCKIIENSLSDLALSTDDFTTMLVQCEKLAKDLEHSGDIRTAPKTELFEVADFIHWLTDGGFVFLGYSEWVLNLKKRNFKDPQIQLGIFKTSNSYKSNLVNEVVNDCIYAVDNNNLIFFTKLHIESIIHRHTRLNHIAIILPTENPDTVRIFSILGIFTSKAISQESSSIPLIRRKLQKLIELEDLAYNSHDYKYLIDVIDHMPKDQALRLDIDSLREIARTVISLQNRYETKLIIRYDSSKRGASVLIVMPRERFNSAIRVKIQEYLENLFSVPSGTSEYHLDLGNKPLARFYFYLPIANVELMNFDHEKLENEINQLSKTWEDNLAEKINSSGLFAQPQEIWIKYSNAFPEEYQAAELPEDCVADIVAIEELSHQKPTVIKYNNTSNSNRDTDCLNLYNLGTQISISKAFPILENAGLEVISQSSAMITRFADEPVSIQRFYVIGKNQKNVASAKAQECLTKGLEAVFSGSAENDWLNSLLINALLDVRSISILRGYSALMWQISSYATKRTISEAFSETPGAAGLFWRMFDIKFNPDHNIDITRRMQEYKIIFDDYLDLLQDVKDITRDRILRGLATLLNNTLRTNYYQGHSYISFKVQSERVEIMPQPRPKFEIFIFSKNFEGVHLRSANISRGGIRWSDRIDDFRSEVLGLVKTQKIKNAVIVPNGAKGGFVIRQLPKQAELIQPAVENAYKDFIRGLLSVTDNLLDGQVVMPQRVVSHDPPDTYLVVAADKGTATFSNIANKIAVEEFNFWLGDAFASGGSLGYDHKKYGITARGAWESVKTHFKDIGINFLKESFTVAGIGDMAGDVFGNGLIYSDKIKLLAAFNHKHIFLDPNPDTESSFKERNRLFALPRSQWTDYNPKLISKGGGLFERFDKEIFISPEVRKSLGIAEEVPEKISGEELISYILQAPVDLLWNGGIGTYVKASAETHAEVNDGTNDRVRISAGQVRAKVVAEGGNLGFTQRARIECAHRGVRINTDAIDNSAGVDLSDHEVNIKILCAELIKNNLMTFDERNTLLESVSGDVVDAVLEHNIRHSVLLSQGTRRTFKSIEYYMSLVRTLHSAGYINRRLEALPDDEEFSDRILKKKGLTSPEIAVFVAGVKMWIKDVLLHSNLCKDPQLQEFLLDYFPPAIQKKYKDTILSHPLALNIIASQVSNNLIDAIGVTFIHRMCVTHSTNPTVVIKCLLAAEFILKTRATRKTFDKFDTFETHDSYLAILQTLGKVLRDAASWLISNQAGKLDLNQIVNLYEKPYQNLAEKGPQVFAKDKKQKFAEKLKFYRDMDVPEITANKLALAPNVIISFELMWAAMKAGSDILLVTDVFTSVYEILKLEAVLESKEPVETPTKWEHQLLLSSFEEIRRSISLLTCQLIAINITEKPAISKKLHESPSFAELATTLRELENTHFSVAALSIVAKLLRTFSI